MAKSKKKTKKSKGPPPAAGPIPTPAALAPTTALSGKKKKKKNKKGTAPPPPPPAALFPAGAACTCGALSEGEGLAGLIFMCDWKTKPDCFHFHVFGLQRKKRRLVEMIRPGTTLFLFDSDMKLLYGVYQATSSGGMRLEPQAFGGRFPAQVRFKIEKDCLPIQESDFKHVIKDNYESGHKFRPQLNSQQVNKLLTLFCAVNSLQQPPPLPCHFHHLEDPIRSEPMACASTHMDPHRAHKMVPPANVPHGPVEHYIRSPPITGHQYLEGPFRSEPMTCASTRVDTHKAPQMAPRVNVPHGPAEHYMHAPPVTGQHYVSPAAPPPRNDPQYPCQQTDPYNRMEPVQRSYPENLISYERPVPQMVARDQYPVPSHHWMPGYEAPRRTNFDSAEGSAFSVANVAGQSPYLWRRS